MKNDFPKIWPVSVSNYFTWIFVFLKECWNVLLAANRVIKRDKYLLLIDASFNYLQIQVKDGSLDFLIYLRKKKLWKWKSENICIYFLNQWINTTTNCHSLYNHISTKKWNRSQEKLKNLKFESIPIVITMIPNKII